VRQSTIITLGASVAFGIFAVVLARGWINEAIRDEYQRSGPAPETVQQTALATVPVVVADMDLNFGDILSPEMLRTVDYPEDALPAGVYATINSMFPDTSKPTIVLRRMSRNETVLDYKISGPGARGSLSSLITDGMRAVSVRVNEVAGVAGFVMPGDFVDVIYTRDDQSRRNGNDLKSDILLQNVKVLGIDQDLNDMSDVPNVVKTVTLEVSNTDGQKLHLAQDAGKLTLTLRKAGDDVIETTASIAQKSILSTPSTTRAAAPRRTYRAPVKTKPKSSNLADVTIIRGDERDQVQVLKDPQSDPAQSELAGG